ncbi:hypothetical protein GCM10010994_17390 [Chelatococcus reniformis]|uniref:Uncharacterized protein n=1 Tax=Chelatococcus reniformis TaxID=1494448 RepID=A0A916U653_9HYPH|nr:hypothetical protein GCM10010994_17390 [Chelatococcus reniformis]
MSDLAAAAGVAVRAPTNPRAQASAAPAHFNRYRLVIMVIPSGRKPAAPLAERVHGVELRRRAGGAKLPEMGGAQRPRRCVGRTAFDGMRGRWPAVLKRMEPAPKTHRLSRGRSHRDGIAADAGAARRS